MSNHHEHYAFPEDPETEAVMRFSLVKRWHMLDVSRTQTLAEHSANVALLAYTIAISAPGMYFGPAIYTALVGLLHDIPEVFTGDPPTPTKKYLSGLKELEARLTPACLLTPEWREDKTIKMLIKICDVADGARFLRMHGIRSDITRHAIEGIDKQLANLEADSISRWPAEVVSHVWGKVDRYAHETGTKAAGRSEEANAGQMDLDLARGPGDSAGSAGPFICDGWPGSPVRNGMAGTESVQDSFEEWKPGLSD